MGTRAVLVQQHVTMQPPAFARRLSQDKMRNPEQRCAAGRFLQAEICIDIRQRAEGLAARVTAIH